MALVVKDRVKETSATTGTGTLTLAGAVVGFQSFSSALSDGDTTYYAIFESSTGEWEVGLGTFTASGTTLARTTILASSNSGSAVNLTAGAADVFITQPATKAAYFDGSGDLILNQDPTSALQAATKQYVDTIAAAGIHYHTACRVESTANLTVTYNNGTAGVGATLTNAGTQAALVIDGVTMVVSDRVLIKNQTAQAQNGVYTVTNVGSASTNWILTRATDADSYGPSDPDALGEGDAFFVSEGNTGAGHLSVMTTSGTITFGTTAIVFTHIAETAVYSAGDGLTLTGTTFAVGAGTGITVNANDVAIGQSVGTGDTVTFATVNANLTGNVTGNVSGSSGSTTGNAATATALQTGRTISLTGDVTGTSGTFDGTGNVSIATTIGANSVALGTDTTGNYVATGAVSGSGLSGSASAEGATFTVTSNATNANTASTIVFRDASGNFSAGTITAALNGNASTATSATDADTVDSLHASQFLRSDANDTFSGVLTSSQTSIGIQFDGAAAWRVSSSDTAHQRADARDDATTESRLHWYGVNTSGSSRGFKHAWYDGSAYININASSSNINFARTTGTANLQVEGNTVWHAGNDGSGSGLDADLLDGVQGSSYLRSDADDSASGDITFTESIQVQSGAGSANPIRIGSGFGSGGNATIHKYGSALYLQYNNGQTSTSVYMGGGGTTANLRMQGGYIDNISSAYVQDYIYHQGDTDTYLGFGTDTITLAAGGSAEVTVTTTGVQLGDTGNGYFQPVTGTYGSIQIDGGAHGGWEGYSIGGIAVFMTNNTDTLGLYNDANNQWAIRATFTGETALYHNGSTKLATTSSGINVTGTAECDTLQFSDGSTQTSAGASTGKAIAMAIVFG